MCTPSDTLFPCASLFRSDTGLRGLGGPRHDGLRGPFGREAVDRPGRRRTCRRRRRLAADRHRRAAVKGGFRQSMAWLHTWTGLLLGWLLFAIFVTGTSAYFQEEITRWKLGRASCREGVCQYV